MTHGTRVDTPNAHVHGLEKKQDRKKCSMSGRYISPVIRVAICSNVSVKTTIMVSVMNVNHLESYFFNRKPHFIKSIRNTESQCEISAEMCR